MSELPFCFVTKSCQYIKRCVLTEYARFFQVVTAFFTALLIQNAAERTPLFGRGIASGGEGVKWWGARRRTAVYVPFSVYTMAWSGEQRAFIVEEFIKKMAGRR